MKKIKRLSALLLCPALAASLLTGCGGSPAENAAPDAGGAAAEPAAQTSTKSITLCLSARDEWLSTLASAAISAGSELGYEINVQDCQNDTNKQIQYVETARNAGDEIMLVNLVDFSLAQEVLDAAGDMKIVFVNRRPTDDALLDENHIYVGSDEAEAGMQQGQYLAAYFKAQGKTEVKYLLLSGDLGMPSTIKRSEYAIKGMEEGGLTVSEATAPLVCKWDRATTIDKLSPILAQGLAYDCIIANNDAMALGAVEALKAAGIAPPHSADCRY